MFEAYRNDVVVVDTDTRFCFVGQLKETTESTLLLHEVTIYDAEEARVPLERFLVECADFGPTPSRSELLLRYDRVVAMSRLRDVIVPGKTAGPPEQN